MDPMFPHLNRTNKCSSTEMIDSGNKKGPQNRFRQIIYVGKKVQYLNLYDRETMIAYIEKKQQESNHDVCCQLNQIYTVYKC